MNTAADYLLVLFLEAVAAIVLGAAIIAGVALFHHHIAYWAAFLISFVLIFGGFLIIDGDWIE